MTCNLESGLEVELLTRVDVPAAGSGSVQSDRVCSKGSEDSAVYVDLAYLPSGTASSTVSVDFFKRLRSAYYIISGDEPQKEAELRKILDALLEGKSGWADVQVRKTLVCFRCLQTCRDADVYDVSSGDSDPNI